MLRVAIITGSTRPGRQSSAVANWVHTLAAARGDASYDVVDIARYKLPLYDEPLPPSMGQYQNEHTRRWAQAIASYDAFVFVTPEYNHGTSAALKNAIDFLHREWNDKVAGFVGYGGTGALRAVESLRLTLAGLSVATVAPQVGLSLFTDWQQFKGLVPDARRESELHRMLDYLGRWARALKVTRVEDAQATEAA